MIHLKKIMYIVYFCPLTLFSNPEIDKDIALNTSVIFEKGFNGGFIDMLYKNNKNGATINFTKRDDQNFSVFQDIRAPTKGIGFCSQYLPAFLSSNLISPILEKVNYIKAHVYTYDSIAACKCYTKSFFDLGFKTLEYVGREKHKSVCGLKLGLKRTFNLKEEIDKFCLNDPFKNPQQDSKTGCEINFVR